MATLQQVDLCLGESLEMLVAAAGEFKKYTSNDTFDDKKDMPKNTSEFEEYTPKDAFDFEKNMLKNIGYAVVTIWDARNMLYERRPDLKRDFQKEYEGDKQRYEVLDSLFMKARNFEKDENFDEARKIYKELLEQSKFGYFKLLAQAGLYRTNL